MRRLWSLALVAALSTIVACQRDAVGVSRGMVKIVAERRSGVIRGIHMLAPNAGDALLARVYAIECGMTVQQLANIWCPYLTISEGIKLAIEWVCDFSLLEIAQACEVSSGTNECPGNPKRWRTRSITNAARAR